jgi:3-hydroxybutyryl-CoA dehydrogenase
MNKMLVGVIGAGAMGSGIAQVAATAGHKVILFDSNHDSLIKSEKGIEKVLLSLKEKQKITDSEAENIRKNLKFSQNIDAFSDCTLVIEAIVENLEVKQSIFEKLEAIVAKECLLATNTSSLSVTSIAGVCSHPERVVGIHFFNPAPLMPLVEIIPGVSTSIEALNTSKSIIDGWGKVTVIAKDTPGFIVNRLARPFYGESIRILEEGIADISTIDWALKEFGGFRMGPFELMDYIGNDINYAVTETVFKAFFYDPRYKPSFTQKRLVEAKRLGRKTSLGYYDYRDGASRPLPEKNPELGKQVFIRVISMLINEAAEALHLKIASREDLDLAMTKGVNYPKGLLKWGDDLGLETVYNNLKRLQEYYGEDRYRPSSLLRSHAFNNQNFY